MTKALKTISIMAILGISFFVFYPNLKSEWATFYSSYFPCRSPITYSLGSYDERFNISEEDFLEIVKEAEMIWEIPAGKNLFEYKALAAYGLKINLIFDYRQEATVKIKDIGGKVSDTRASYDSLKEKYDTLQRIYLEDKKDYQGRVANFQKRQAEYNEKVNYWNSRGGAPSDEYQELQSEGAAIKAELSAIRKIEIGLNDQPADINALIAELNRLAKTLNINVGVLNNISENRGEEFTEGEYKSDTSGQSIDIYEFSSKLKLKRVLAHEFGHALGLNHVEDPKAIMYRLNESTNSALTDNDLTALKAHCKIK